MFLAPLRRTSSIRRVASETLRVASVIGEAKANGTKARPRVKALAARPAVKARARITTARARASLTAKARARTTVKARARTRTSPATAEAERFLAHA